ncbi:MAG: Hsp20 family protein [Bryobacteraceae bacterium]
MSNVAIKTYQPSETGADRLLERVTNVIDQIRRRAFELSTMHGQEGLNHLDDWVQAEHELLACQRCEVRSEENHFVAEVDAADFEPTDLSVSLLGNDLMIEGTSRTQKIVNGQETEATGRSIMVRAFLPNEFDPTSLKAELHNGVLRVTADRRNTEPVGVPVEPAKAGTATA